MKNLSVTRPRLYALAVLGIFFVAQFGAIWAVRAMTTSQAEPQASTQLLTFLVSHLIVLFGFWWIWWVGLNHVFKRNISLFKVGVITALIVLSYNLGNALIVGMLPLAWLQSSLITLVFLFMGLATAYFWQKKYFSLTRRQTLVLLGGSVPLVIIWFLIFVVFFQFLA